MIGITGGTTHNRGTETVNRTIGAGQPLRQSSRRRLRILGGCLLLVVGAFLGEPSLADSALALVGPGSGGGSSALQGAAAGANGPMDLHQMLARWDLRLETDTGDRMVIRGDDVTLTLAPGLPVVRLNQKTYRLSRPPRYVRGRLRAPEELVRLLARVVPAGALHSDLTIILDPGHGGRDPGAIGYGRLREKDVVLDVALEASRMLRARGARVRMTRRDDRFLSLQQRADIANRSPNSIFVSIHANAARDRRAAGVETYVLSGGVSDTYRLRQASRRYRIDKDGVRAGSRQERLLLDQACRSARADSVTLARALHPRLVRAAADTDRGVKRANFHVLRENYFAPAVLLELGFLTHPSSARKLGSAAHRKRLAAAIAEGLLDYLREVPRTADLPLADSRIFARR
jgi:N-acetylmuramoyl-L-alanine amidase